MEHLNPSGHFPSGNVRYYYRPKGQKGIPLPDLPENHPLFLAAYAKAAGVEEAPKPTHKTGSIGAAVTDFLASDDFKARAATTREQWRRQLDDIRIQYGKGLLIDLSSIHIRKDLSGRKPNPAKNRRTIWRGFTSWCFDEGLIATDPGLAVRKPRTPKGDGHTPWVRSDIKKFRSHWPIGTPQRLAFELLYRSCAAIGDAIKLGPSNIADGWMTYARSKTGAISVIPMRDEPEWFEANEDLWRCFDAQNDRHLVFMTTAHGRPRSPKAAAQWFSAACRAAKLAPGKTAHGLRHFRASSFRENGAEIEKRMAILGHESVEEAKHYSRAADLKKIVSGTKSSNSIRSSSNSRKKSKR